MASNYQLGKYFQNFKGLDLRVSDLLRESGSATEVSNVTLRKTGALSKRKGYKTLMLPAGGYGTSKYININNTTGVVTEELVSVDDDLYKMLEDTGLSITYTGSGSAYYNIILESDGEFYFQVFESGASVLNQNLGTGYESSPYLLSALISTVNALSNFTCASTGVTTEPAAFLPSQESIDIPSTGVTVSFKYWTKIDTPDGITDPLATFYAARNDSDFENASFASVNNVLFCATGHDHLHKYDGNRFYRAGLPTPSTPTDGAGGGGSLTYSSGEKYSWKYTYEYTDAKGNILESDASATVDYTTTGAAESRNITVSNLQNTTGFNTDQGTVDGNQAGVNTITMIAGHNIKANDNVYLVDQSSGDTVKRNVTSTTNTSIVIDGDAVDVSDTDIISNVKIILYRTKADGITFYISKELINDTGNATQAYDDGTADSGIVIDYVAPVKPHTLPPKAKYIDVWRNNLILTGIRDDVNTVFYSDIDGAEFFPTDNSFLTESPKGDKNSGIGTLDNFLFIFKEESIAGVTGDLDQASFTVDIVSRQGVGCLAHNTIQEVNGKLWFLSEYGIFSISNKGLQEESINIKTSFGSASTFEYKQAIAYHWLDESKYLIMLPELNTSSGGDKFVDNTNTKVFMYDIFWQAWFEWSDLDFLGGIAEVDNKLYFSNRQFDSVSSSIKAWSNRISDNGTRYDYADHTEAIDFSYKSHWETLGEPSLFKKFLRLKIQSLDISLGDFETNDFSLLVTTEHDYDTQTVSSITYDFSGGASGWGESPWGDFPWGESRLPSMSRKLKRRKARSMRVLFSNSTLHENVLISGYELEVATPYAVAIKE